MILAVIHCGWIELTMQNIVKERKIKSKLLKDQTSQMYWLSWEIRNALLSVVNKLQCIFVYILDYLCVVICLSVFSTLLLALSAVILKHFQFVTSHKLCTNYPQPSF